MFGAKKKENLPYMLYLKSRRVLEYKGVVDAEVIRKELLQAENEELDWDSKLTLISDNLEKFVQEEGVAAAGRRRGRPQAKDEKFNNGYFFYLSLGFDALFANVIAAAFYYGGKDNYDKTTKIVLFTLLLLVPTCIMMISVVSETIMGSGLDGI